MTRQLFVPECNWSLPPMQWLEFARSADEIDVTYQVGDLRLLSSLDLITITKHVNDTMQPDTIHDARIVDGWTINKTPAHCGDYVVTKRHMLLMQGWPSEWLQVVTCYDGMGKLHAVLAVSDPNVEGHSILCNKFDVVKPVWATGYKWLTIQNRRHPNQWQSAVPVQEPAPR